MNALVAQVNPKALNCEFVGEANRLVFEAVRGAAGERSFALTLGGDHSVGLGSVAGVLANNPDTGIVWVDAHADINSPVWNTGQRSGGSQVHCVVHVCPPLATH
jgi:arginase family enzyme